MGLITSEGLSLLVGDGAGAEGFAVLRGASVSRFEITQRLSDSSSVADDAWLAGVGTSERRAVVECDFLASGDGAAQRLRNLAVTGAAGNIRLQVSTTQMLQCAVFVTRYREVIQPGEIKHVLCRLESSGTVSLV